MGVWGGLLGVGECMPSVPWFSEDLEALADLSSGDGAPLLLPGGGGDPLLFPGGDGDPLNLPGGGDAPDCSG